MVVLTFCLALAAEAPAQSQPKESPQAESRPNFTGTWVMDAAKSDWGGVEAPGLMRYVIRHRGGTLMLLSTQDSVTKRLEMMTDGQERMTEEDADSEIWARVFWEGKTLVWEGRRKAKPAHEVEPVHWSSRWSLSEDGKTLTVKREIVMTEGTLEQSIQFDKK
jgi:hypothetical protein